MQNGLSGSTWPRRSWTWLLGQTERAVWGYEAMVECLAGSGWASSGASEQSCLAVSRARRREPGDSHEVVGGGDQGGVHLYPLAPAITCAAQTADGLHPAEGLLDVPADPLTDLVARMPNRANVDRRVTCARQVAGHVRSDRKSRSAPTTSKTITSSTKWAQP
jgi:hypothetical protein